MAYHEKSRQDGTAHENENAFPSSYHHLSPVCCRLYVQQPSQADIRRKNVQFMNKAVSGRNPVKPPREARGNNKTAVAGWVLGVLLFLLLGSSECAWKASEDTSKLKRHYISGIRSTPQSVLMYKRRGRNRLYTPIIESRFGYNEQSTEAVSCQEGFYLDFIAVGCLSIRPFFADVFSGKTAWSPHAGTNQPLGA